MTTNDKLADALRWAPPAQGEFLPADEQPPFAGIAGCRPLERAPQPAPAPVQDVCPRCSSAWEPEPVSTSGGAMDKCSNADCGNMRWARPRGFTPSSVSTPMPNTGTYFAQPPAPGEVELPPLPELPTIRDRQSIENYATAYARAAIAALAQQPDPMTFRHDGLTYCCACGQEVSGALESYRARLAGRGEKGVQS